MPFAGTKLAPETIAEKLHALGFRDLDLVEMVATILGESQGYTEAYNDNVDSRGRVLSRDVGLGQINIRARDIGTARERKLYDPDYNLREVKRMFDTRETLVKRRRFNPWYAFTKGWATFPGWWIYTSKEASERTGQPRHWAPTGRYLHKAVVGVANFYARHYGLTPRPFLDLPEEPPVPRKPPLNKVGPRPVENDGRGSLG